MRSSSCRGTTDSPCTEPARRTRREAYPEQFRMTVEDITNAPEVPTIPPLRRGRSAHAGKEESGSNR
ncbi:non-oxidative hydroxyarylic acid decarboxylases subunit D [Pseudonocardia alaniniphila]|uniref:non-oxidative hydroxyarylic acid decarboxylases subunit D n=1 Tax=Pseudonocardia alaniniphila TaxID=75291 RepID=UPI002402C82A|nr:non-oxidative hydroxyarylic acid decarboxylases subunit D [Pseudonocardia alaniniphila]